ncbi:MAG: TonB-dependent receptor plug domain-containing protein [Muribaculaceae bacterium]|nr:TonB-dependent receptor plug domain-containing protein [Muribaculaceae bacterium]
MKKIFLLSMMLCIGIAMQARGVTIKAVDQPAATVFRSIVEQTGKNFVYSSELLKDMHVSVDVTDKSLKEALAIMFKDSDIEWKIKGKNIILKKKATPEKPKRPKATDVSINVPQPMQKVLDEVVVVSRLEAPAVETSEIGAKKLTDREIINTPALFGESDVIKALHMQPGISEGQEGMAGMNVHGGNADENLYMLDNAPLYQVNHFAGLFSAFNAEAIRYIDFFKSSIPAKYDGRLSSYLDVRTKNGSRDGHHGAFRLGLTSGAFNIDGPIGEKTTYSVALRRSWFDVLSAPLLALANSASDDEKIRLQYAFMDLNAKVTHRFSNKANMFASVYFGNDILKTGSSDKQIPEYGWYDDGKADFHWGNLVAQTGLNYRLNPVMTAEFTAAYTRYFSDMKHDWITTEITHDSSIESHSISKTKNNINDWIFRADFDWRPDDKNRVRFGGNYILHSFLPARTDREYTVGTKHTITRDSTWTYMANEANVYIEDDWHISKFFSMNAGLHLSLFNIDGKTDFGFGPRISLSYRPAENWAVKAAYARTNQYVHQLSQTYLSLPTDQWVPITGRFKPQNSDKISFGAYWQSDNKLFGASIEGYWRVIRNLVDYKDEYYLYPLTQMWNAQLCSGKGTAKGIDFKIEKVYGKLTGHISYSLAWSDRTFPDKNGGLTFPARFDNRHTINILLNWNISDKVSFNAAWTGHSGNRFTLLPQMWESPEFANRYTDDESPLKARINNYQLPFYHRLDLSFTVRNSRGYWTFGLFNAYCHMNTVAIRRAYDKANRPVFQKVKLLPIIPSISYTWQF